jgi:excinuclease ABC subunit C
LVLLAVRNATTNYATRRNKRDDGEAALEALQTRLRLSRLPRRIECYDVSHIQGSDPVASMVVFVDGAAENSSYRSFKIRAADVQNDDFASMHEVLKRRLHRALEDEDWALPDLIVIDGGKGQLGRAIAAMQDLGIALGDEGVDIVSLAKERRMAVRASKRGLERLREEGRKSATPGQALADHVAEDTGGGDTEVRPERVFVPGAKDAIVLAHGSAELYLMTRLRDEAHRFAITHHRKRRGKRSIASVLDGIAGVGPVTKKALIGHFGTVKAIRAATVDQLCEVEGVGPKLAAAIHGALFSGDGG